MGEMCNFGWFIHREGVITGENFKTLVNPEVGQVKNFLNAPRIIQLLAVE